MLQPVGVLLVAAKGKVGLAKNAITCFLLISCCSIVTAKKEVVATYLIMNTPKTEQLHRKL